MNDQFGKEQGSKKSYEIEIQEIKYSIESTDNKMTKYGERIKQKDK